VKKLFILGAAALIAAPVMAQQQNPSGSSQTNATIADPQAGPPQGTMTTPPPPPPGGGMTTPPPPPPADGSMTPPPPPGGMSMGTSPSGARIVMGPMNTTPPPAANANPPVCKRGQTDDCIEPGARRKGRR